MRCTHRVKDGSSYCGIHKRCRFPIHKTTKSTVQQTVKDQKKKAVRDIMGKVRSLTTQQRQRLFQECGKKCCPLDTKDCSYAVCPPGDVSCIPECDRVRSAFVKKNMARKRQKQPDPQKYQKITKALDLIYKTHCSKKK